MGNDDIAEKPQEDDIDESEVIETEEDAPVEEGEDPVVEVVEEVENEVVFVGDEGSQPDNQAGIRNRVNKLNVKVEAAKTAASDAEQEAAQLREQNKLLNMALEQSKSGNAVNTPPDPLDFDEGVKDAKFIQAQKIYQAPLIAEEVKRQTLELSQQSQIEADNLKLVRMQEDHFNRADKLGVKDFDETADKVTAALGKDVINAIIQLTGASEKIVYHLGKDKNKSKLDKFGELAKTNRNKAILELGKLEALLIVKPKPNNNPVPNPDEPLVGGVPSAHTGKRGPKGASYS